MPRLLHMVNVARVDLTTFITFNVMWWRLMLWYIHTYIYECDLKTFEWLVIIICASSQNYSSQSEEVCI